MLSLARNNPVPPRTHRHKRRHFLVAWIRAPLKMGALVPSSRTLARAMAAPLNLEKPGIVVELGAGTGVVTHALLDTGIDPSRLLVIEREPKLHAILEHQFHGLNVLCADAAELDKVLAERKAKHVNAIVSSLPLLSMPKQVRHAIEHCMASLIDGDGILIQFTYGPRSPIRHAALRKYGLTGRRIKTVLTNVPPAHVWVYRKERRKSPR